MDDDDLAALLRATELVGDRWSLPVVAALGAGPRRFADLQERLGGVAATTLSRRLDDLGRSGLVVSRPYQTRPVRMAYELSARGAELQQVAEAMVAWERGRSTGDGTGLGDDGREAGDEPGDVWV